MWYVIGLGNKGDEYENTRHNVGRDTVLKLAKDLGLKFVEDSKSGSLVAKGKVGGKPATLILPEKMMNNSGKSAKVFITKKAEAKNLVVVRDDIDMGLGSLRLVFNRGTGGHRGVDSVVSNIKTTEFYQLKVGVLPTTPSGKAKKPKGEKKVISFILSEFKPSEKREATKSIKRACECIEILVSEGFQKSATISNI